MKFALLISVLFSAVYFAAHGQANTKLSNLVAPTAMNADLLPNSTNTRNLGSNTFGWKSIYTTGRYYINGGLFLHNKGIDNTFVGDSVGTVVTSGNYNTGMGDRALFRTTTGSYNTAFGRSALYNNTTGIDNTANGYQTLHSNDGGSYNTASGFNALYHNTSGSDNTAYGVDALLNNITGTYNIAIGNYSQNKSSGGRYNTATGYRTLYSNTGSWYNTAVGCFALQSSTGGNNTAVGMSALASNTTGNSNTALGFRANVSTGGLRNATAIGADATVDANNKVRIGNTFVSSIGGQVGWSNFSDGRYKRNIKADVHGLDFINSLSPVTYTLDIEALNAYYSKGRKEMKEMEGNSAETSKDSEEQASKVVYNGFIAQEVEEAAKKLKYEFSGVDKPESKEGLYGLRYSDFVVPLVKAVQELSKKNETLEEENRNQQKQIDELRQMILELNGSANTVTSASAYLEQSSPNPSSGSTLIRYHLPANFSKAHLVLTNMKGQVVETYTLNNNGTGQIIIQSAALASGSYTYSLYVDGMIRDSKQLVIAR